jgi:elongation factor P
MATTTDIKNGLTIEYNEGLYKVVSFQHVKPGKGPAFVRTKLKNLKTARTIENTFSSGAKITIVRIERRPYQYLYQDEAGFNFMHAETFEQVSILADLVDNADLMKEGQTVEINYHVDTETPLTVEMPPFVELIVASTIAGEKGNTASSNALKPATLETGAEIMVPMFINEGDLLKIDTRDRSYSERVKK